MDRFGKWGLRVAITVVIIMAANTVIRMYLEASPAEQERFWAVGWLGVKIGLIGCLCFGVAIVIVLVLAAGHSTPLDQKTRRDIHDATEE